MEKTWHYRRICQKCGFEWAGLHCPHDGIQRSCPQCCFHQIPQQGECDCEFDWEDEEEKIDWEE